MWRLLNSSVGRVRKSVLPEHSSSLGLAENFNKFFIDKVRNIRINLLQLTCGPLNEYLTRLEPPPVQSSLNSFSLASESEIRYLLLTKPPKESPKDVIPQWLLKKCLNEFLPIVTSMVNIFLCSGLPSHHKHAMVTPLVKHGNLNPNTLSNYRPVSNLSSLSKIVERIVVSRLTGHLDTNNLYDTHQCAYRRFHSCETALVSLTDFVYSAADNGEVTVVVLLDLSAAFDTVDHTLLLDRLKDIGVYDKAHEWFQCYLSQRSQSVIIGQSHSIAKHISTGVPQGSVLAPVLFSIYMRQLGQLISLFKINYKLYADDIQLYISFKPSQASSILINLEKCIEVINSWLIHSMLSLNTSKSEVFLMGTRQQLKKLPDFHVNIVGSSIRSKSIVRDLGILFDGPLTFEPHVRQVCRAAFSNLHVISRISKHLSRSHRLLLIHSLVFSRVEYCCSILYGITNQSLTKLERIMLSPMGLVLGRKVSSRVDLSQEMKKLRWLTVRQRICHRILMLTHEVLFGRGPKFLADLLKVQFTTRLLRSSSGHLLEIPFRRSVLGQRAFSFVASTLWNRLPPSVRCVCKKSKFSDLVFDSLLND